MFILDGDDRTEAGWTRYEEYVRNNASRFPPAALELATSAWYFGSSDHRAPHDSRLEELVLTEASVAEDAGWHDRTSSLVVRLRGAYDDGWITLRYPQVHHYLIDGTALQGGHHDWRYDELRLDDAGNLVHEIEWCGMRDTARWLIVASDMTHTWQADH